MELDMLILKFIWKRKYTEIAKNFLKRQREGAPADVKYKNDNHQNNGVLNPEQT